ncbi:MAG: glycosyltransferase [Clostridia bacterium]|nr:glycosyltransferase [Clostridia bacterium]
MIITLVTDQFFQNNHGTSISGQRFYNGLIKRGHTVRVVSVDDGTNTEYALKERYFGKPITKLINSQGFQFGKPDKEVIKKAIEGSDLVHLYLPFKLECKTMQICREMNIPCTAAFHLAPENITSTIYLNKSKLVNGCLWKSFYNKMYRFAQHIHCPSQMIANQLEKHKYKANLHVISNGYNEEFKVQPAEKPEELKDKIVITFIGRFSREKRHDLIIKAVKQSKYADKIQLVFGGKGPTKKHIMKMARKLPNYPIFSFFTRPQLVELLNYADLYVHPADIEIEGMSCIEAIACGCVPIVSNSPKSATPQFTVHEMSIFEHGNAKDLTAKIDWWIEHPEELKEQRKVVAEHAKNFRVERSMDYYLDMFEAGIKDWNKDYNGKKKDSIHTNIINNYKKA